MSDLPNDQESQENEENNEDLENPSGAAASTDESGGSENESTENQGNEDELPEWARKSLTKANQEAAQKRAELKELREKLEQSKSIEEVDAMLAGLQTKAEQAEREAIRERAGRKFNLPDELVGRLSGDTEDDILADAENLAKLFQVKQGKPAPLPPAGGRNPQGAPDEYDPLEEYKKTKRLR